MLAARSRLCFILLLSTLFLGSCQKQPLTSGKNTVVITACKIVTPSDKQPWVSASYLTSPPEQLIVTTDKSYRITFLTTSPLSGLSFIIPGPQTTKYSINRAARRCATPIWPWSTTDCPYDFKLTDVAAQQDCADPTIHVTK
jgi:hypothetical protein